MIPQLDFSDLNYFRDAIADQDSLMIDIIIRRCIGLNKDNGYPGARPEVLRNNIYTRAELSLAVINETSRQGGGLLVGDLHIRCDVQLRGGGDPGETDYGDKINPANVADIITIGVPYQGDWYVVGAPQFGELVNHHEPVFYNAFLRRIRTGFHGK